MGLGLPPYLPVERLNPVVGIELAPQLPWESVEVEYRLQVHVASPFHYGLVLGTPLGDEFAEGLDCLLATLLPGEGHELVCDRLVVIGPCFVHKVPAEVYEASLVKASRQPFPDDLLDASESVADEDPCML